MFAGHSFVLPASNYYQNHSQAADLKRLIVSVCMMLIGGVGSAQEVVLYKQTDTTKLYLEVHRPARITSSEARPGMVFFFGGGWKTGDRHHLLNYAQYFSQRGMVCFLADYRTASKHQTTPFDALEDAKAAVRFIKGNATSFGVDSARLVASGGSAGGHLAAATALIEGYNDSTDDLSTSSRPGALVLFNPVIDNGPGGYGYERIGSEYKSFSPIHCIKEGAPPTLFLLGTEDQLIPVETAKYYKTVMERVGSRCDLLLHQGEGHGFFNYRNFENYKKTVRETDKFLQSINYLAPEPVVEIR